MMRTRKIPRWIQTTRKATHQKQSVSLIDLPVDVLERVATSGGGMAHVGWGLAVACQCTRSVAIHTQSVWATCSLCTESIVDGYVTCDICDGTMCPGCVSISGCAESLHSDAETPTLCQGCANGMELGTTPPGWARCEQCAQILCPVCHVAGLPAYNMCYWCTNVL